VSRRAAARVLAAALCAAGPPWPVTALGQPGALPRGDAPIAVLLTDLGAQTMRLDGSFTVASSPATAWSVLTDYDHIQRFVRSMRSSRVVGREAGCLLVEQESVARFLLFHRTLHVRLEVCEAPPRSISFEDVSRVSFQRYRGAWTVRETAGGVEVAYQLAVQGGLVALLPHSQAQKMVRDLLEEVRAEVRRRAAAEAPGG
jgi:carbon monoxide dehydrogenase subunit G